MDEPVLKNAWDADVPASDPRFALAVMARIEQRRFRRELATTVGLTAAAMGLLVLVMPAVEIAWPTDLASDLAILSAMAAVTWMLPQLFPARD